MVNTQRIDWVDYAKGICIVLVVMMHSTLGVEKAAGAESWLNGFIEWARPFRMPDFFLISGLFLASRIDRPWRSFADAKILHFAYFYILWMTIQFAMRAPGLYAQGGLSELGASYLTGLVQPFGTLWFIYLLAIFFAVAKLLRPLPPLLVLSLAVALEVAPIHTGSLIIDEFASRFVYFYAGSRFAGAIFAFAGMVRERSVAVIIAGLFIWAMGNTVMVETGLAFAPGFGLFAGAIGAAAVVAAAALLSRFSVGALLRICGERSLQIYLAFVVFMAPTRMILLKAGVPEDLALVAVIVAVVAIGGALALAALVRGTPLSFLFTRPAWARLGARPAERTGEARSLMA